MQWESLWRHTLMAHQRVLQTYQMWCSSYMYHQQSFVTAVSDVLVVFFEKQEYADVIDILDKLYTSAACKIGIKSNPQTFVQLSMDAMERLQDTA